MLDVDELPVKSMLRLASEAAAAIIGSGGTAHLDVGMFPSSAVPLIHLLLAIAVVLLIWNLLTGRSTVV